MREMVITSIKSVVAERLEKALFESLADIGLAFTICESESKKLMESPDSQEILSAIAEEILKKV